MRRLQDSLARCVVVSLLRPHGLDGLPLYRVYDSTALLAFDQFREVLARLIERRSQQVDTA